ncbi:MAG: UPF0280 family protein [Candidatus Bathyarchaeota archaeon]|nr:UPF0280 family protein [Candidatus Bathyarchaeota archaeon]
MKERRKMKTNNLFKRVFRYKETNCTIIADNERAVKTAISSIKYHRKKLEEYVRNHPRFLCSLRPVPVNKGPPIVRLMAETAEKANVGPMAAVAGVLADLAVKNMTLDESEVAVVENGGEVSAISNRPIDIALSAGDSPLSRTLGFRLRDFPTGVATSSGLFSHALSFGEAEAVTIFSTNAGLADAAATAIGNLIKGKNYRRAIERGINKALSIQGVKGVFILYRGMVGMAGRTPQIIKVSTAETSLRNVKVDSKLGGQTTFINLDRLVEKRF